MSFRWPWQARRQVRADRWVIVDVESSGLDPSADRLLAIAGVAVHFESGRPWLDPADSLEVVLQQNSPTADKANILIHGIGVGAQRAGMAPTQALTTFEQWVGDSALVAFHAPFDEAMIHREMTRSLRRKLPNPWLDLAYVARLALPKETARSLDEWMALRHIVCAVRHQAAADAWATGQLLLSLWPALESQQEPRDALSLHRRAEQLRWLSRTG